VKEELDYKSKYLNLLAVIHRDGGHYVSKHGESKAAEDGIQKIMTAYFENERLKEELAKWKAYYNGTRFPEGSS